jgi:hypothetical protein
MLSIFLKKSNLSDGEIQSVQSNRTILDEKEAFLELDSSFFTCTQGSRKGGNGIDFKELKWSFPVIDDANTAENVLNSQDIFLKDEIKVDSRNGINCLETFGKNALIYGDMDGNIARINLRKALISPGGFAEPEILFCKLLKFPLKFFRFQIFKRSKYNFSFKCFKLTKLDTSNRFSTWDIKLDSIGRI